MHRHTQHSYRKPRPKAQPDKDSFSTKKRALGKLIGQGNFTQALTQLNGWQAAGNLPPETSAQILCFVADILFAQDNFDQARKIYQQAIPYNTNQQSASWLRPYVGQVRSLLAEANTDDAQSIANQAIAESNTRQQVYQESLNAAKSLVAGNGSAAVPPKCVMPSLVATRMGQLFFQEGEVALAGKLWQSAVDSAEPKAAVKARIGLAEIALREGRASDAAQMATSALTIGQFGAKTLPAWELLLTSNYQMGNSALDGKLVQGLRSAGSGVQGRAALLIARTMRSYNDEQWIGFANSTLAGPQRTSPVIVAELQKMLLATQQSQAGDPSVRQTTAAALAAVPSLGPKEFLAASKSHVNASLALQQDPGVETVLNQGVKQYGANYFTIIARGLARVYLQSGLFAPARTLLQRALAAPSDRFNHQSRLQWALGELESQAGNGLAAATAYLMVANDPNTPLRFALLARLRWMRSLIATGQVAQIRGSLPALKATVTNIKDYDLALDFARQLKGAQPDLNSLSDTLIQQGFTVAQSALRQTQSPTQTLQILFKLTRRLTQDFDLNEPAISVWDSIASPQLNQMWTEKVTFWRYLSLVSGALREVDRNDDSQQLLDTYLNDPATPPQGMAVLGSAYGLQMIEDKKYSKAFEVFASIVQQAPAKTDCARAYYWLALKSVLEGNSSASIAYATQIETCLGNEQTCVWQRLLKGQAVLLKAGLNVQNASQIAPKMSTHSLNVNLSLIQSDLASLQVAGLP